MSFDRCGSQTGIAYSWYGCTYVMYSTSVQVTVVWLVVVGQLPQFDARMAGQSGATGLQLKIGSSDGHSFADMC